MSRRTQVQLGAFPELTDVSEARWAALLGLIAVAFRPPSRRNNSFADHRFMPLVPGPTMFVERWQYAMWPGRTQPARSVILLALKFVFDVYSGRIYADAKVSDECSPAVYDCALPYNLWESCRHHLDPLKNETAADLSLAMFREAKRTLDAREPIPHQPLMPEFYLAYTRRPAFERGVVVLREASAAFGKAPADVTDAELEEYFWAQTIESCGYILVPQRYLARQGDYPTHPVDGSVRPAAEGSPGQWNGLWYFGDGRWNAAAQRPDNVLVHMGNVLGRPFRNPAFTVLKAGSFFPAAMGYKQFEESLGKEVRDPTDGVVKPELIMLLHQQFRDAIAANETIVEMLVAEMRKAINRRTVDMATDDDLKMALDRPDLPMNLSFASSVQVVRYNAPPRPESMTWQYPGSHHAKRSFGGHVDLYSTKRGVWTSRVEPADFRPEGSREHGRTSAPFAN